MYVRVKSLSIDDLFQLQSLLSYEQEERTRHIEECQNSPNMMRLGTIYRVETPTEVSAIAFAEKERLDQAIYNIRSLRDEYRRERTRQVQSYIDEYQKQDLIRAVLEEEEERYYRQRIAAAIEQRRAAQMWNGYLERQKETQDYSQYRSNQLAELLKQAFLEQEKSHYKKENEEKEDALTEVWKLFLEQNQGQDEPESELQPEPKATEVTEKNPDTEVAPALSGHVVTLKDLVRQLASQPVFINEQSIYADEPKPSGIWQKDSPIKKDGVQRPKVEEIKKPFFPEHILTEAEPTPTKEFMTDSPLTEANQAFVDRIAAEQQHEREDPKKIQSLKILDEINNQLQSNDLVSRFKEVLLSPLTFTRQEENSLLMANTQKNRAFLGIEDELVRILLRLDSVESLGDESIRDYRKKLNSQSQDMLDQLDAHKQSELQKFDA
ncbi:hypothetical protein BY458DRAFT_500965 [Sporodiniella umbellata]|nr:hypothetical protein BY458DRAFT_500965 [Sporodiniella umbellata]